MDRVATLEALEGLVARHGVVAFLSDHEPKAPENAWWGIVQDLRLVEYGPAKTVLCGPAHAYT
jgi:hypothetical protein